MAKHRRDDPDTTEFINMDGVLGEGTFEEEEYKPRRYEEHVGEVTRIREIGNE